MKAENLNDPSGKGNVDPYAVIECGKHKDKTDPCKGSMDPVCSNKVTRRTFVYSLFTQQPSLVFSSRSG